MSDEQDPCRTPLAACAHPTIFDVTPEITKIPPAKVVVNNHVRRNIVAVRTPLSPSSGAVVTETRCTPANDGWRQVRPAVTVIGPKAKAYFEACWEQGTLIAAEAPE